MCQYHFLLFFFTTKPRGVCLCFVSFSARKDRELVNDIKSMPHVIFIIQKKNNIICIQSNLNNILYIGTLFKLQFLIPFSFCTSLIFIVNSSIASTKASGGNGHPWRIPESTRNGTVSWTEFQHHFVHWEWMGFDRTPVLCDLSNTPLLTLTDFGPACWEGRPCTVPEYLAPSGLFQNHTFALQLSRFLKSHTFRSSSKSVVTPDARETLAGSSPWLNK